MVPLRRVRPRSASCSRAPHTHPPRGTRRAHRIGLASYIYSLDGQTTYNYLPFATSAYDRHSLISTIQVAQSVISTSARGCLTARALTVRVCPQLRSESLSLPSSRTLGRAPRLTLSSVSAHFQLASVRSGVRMLTLLPPFPQCSSTSLVRSYASPARLCRSCARARRLHRHCLRSRRRLACRRYHPLRHVCRSILYSRLTLYLHPINSGYT